MKLVLFSPLHGRSPVGRVTAAVASSLGDQGHDVVVVRTEELLTSEPLPCAAPVLSWTADAEVQEAADAADALVYAIGNDYASHVGGLQWMSRRRGLVALHDIVLADLFTAWLPSRPLKGRRSLLHWYGRDVADTFAHQHDQFMARAWDESPMTEWMAAMAHAVIAPSEWGMDRVRRACPGPSRVVPLPYVGPPVTGAGPREEGAKVRVLTIVDDAPNQRIDSVIQAIASSATLRDRVRYHLCGSMAPGAALGWQRLALDSGVDLEISSDADAGERQAALISADIACCMHGPVPEAASPRIVEALLHGNAVIAGDAGFAADVPEGCAITVSPADEVSRLRTELERLVADPGERRAMASRGRAWASTFTADTYARELVDVAGLMLRALPAINMSWQFGLLLREWGATQDVLTAPEITEPLAIFNPPDA